MLKRNTKDHMLVQQPEANDVKALDMKDYERERTTGRRELGPINEDYHHYRHSLDDRYILWRNGNKDLDIYDCENMKVDETVPNFWTHQGQQCQPIAAVSNREVSRILGLSQLDKNTQCLHYYEKDDKDRVTMNSFRSKDIFPTSSFRFTQCTISRRWRRMVLEMWCTSLPRRVPTLA